MNPDELEHVYSRIGCCLWNIQYLENVLHHSLTLKVAIRTPGRVRMPEAEELLRKQKAATLGTALATAVKHQALPQELLQRLRDLKEERDWLVHRIQHEDGQLLYTADGRSRLLERLNRLEGNSIRVKMEIAKDLVAFCEKAGVNWALAEARARQTIEELKR